MSQFQEDLKSLINSYSQENASGTPDFILAEYLMNCLVSYNQALQDRERWYGRSVNGHELAERGAGTWAKEPAALEQARLASIEVNEITEADIEAVEDEIGMGRGAWDMVDRRELIVACIKVVCGKSA